MTPLLGVTLPQFTGDTDRLIASARRAEAAGLDSIWLFDHMWPLSGDKDRPILEQWSTLAYLAAKTEHIAIGTLVTRSTVRHPGLLAKMAATVASIAPGRLILTIGSGDSLNRAENDAFGLPYFAGDDRTRQLDSTVSVLRSFLSGEPVNAADDFVSIDDLRPSPVAGIPPRIWVGGNSRAARETAREAADGWNAWGKDAVWYAERAEGFPGDGFELSWGGNAELNVDGADGPPASPGPEAVSSGEQRVSGPPERFAETLRALADAGAGHLIVSFSKPTPETYEALATMVRPLLS